jgi:hypothetical protein
MDIESLRLKLENDKAELLKRHKAHAVGIGYKYVNGKRTDKIAVIFYVYRKRPLAQLQKLKIEPVPETIYDYPTDVREVREGFKPRSEKEKHRPFQGGVSGISIKEEGAAATLGIVNQKGEVLSNNHVLANESLTTNPTAEKGDKFLQPSWLDGGTEADVAGELDRWVDLKPLGYATCPIGKGVAKTLNFLAELLKRKGRFIYLTEEENYMDGAVGVAYEGLWKPGVMGLGEVEGARDLKLGEKVVKRGRTTSLTKGIVTAVGVTVDVGGYQGIYTCRFVDQITIEADENSFSEAGDSGSAILTEQPLQFVALLFAGGQDTSGRDITIATPYKYVKEYLNYQLP